MGDSHASVVFFHHAGGNAAAMNAFAQRFSDAYNIILMEMPGRGRRRQEILLNDAQQIIADFVSHLPSEGTLIFVGHSLGAYIAYMMARYCEDIMTNRDVILVAISNEPIHCRKKFSSLEFDGDFRQKLLDFASLAGQLPNWLCESEILIERFLQVLVADLKTANSIQNKDIRKLQKTPLLVIYGKDDPLLPLAPYRWKECTNAMFRMVSVPGEHFILLTQAEFVYNIINKFISDIVAIEIES